LPEGLRKPTGNLRLARLRVDILTRPYHIRCWNGDNYTKTPQSFGGIQNSEIVVTKINNKLFTYSTTLQYNVSKVNKFGVREVAILFLQMNAAYLTRDA
jgi:hypothetical protein